MSALKIEHAYSPIIKLKGFDPSPVAGKIPIWADSRSNPDVIGTANYDEFWEEQFDRCINGYRTGGLDIPGRYYFYLNFVIINGLFGPQYPWYVDLDYGYFSTVEEIKIDHKTGLISIKARRKGLSEKAQSILGHGIRFIEGYRGAITAGLERYTVGLRQKFLNSQAKFVDEMRLNVLDDNVKTYRTGYEVNDPVGGFIEEGYLGHLSFETMYDKAEKLEGEYFHDVICEESGQYEKLGGVYISIKPALEFGAEMLGTFYIYGTGGNILTGSKDFKEMWDDSDAYGLVRMWVPGTRLYHPFFGNKRKEYLIDEDTREKIDGIPNLRHLKEWERFGCEDLKAAEEYILKKRIFLSKLKNKKRLKQWNQKYPLTIEEAFTSGGNNQFDDESIYSTLFEVEGDVNAWRPVVLDFVYEKDEDGALGLKWPLETTARPAKPSDPEWKIVQIYQDPDYSMRDLDVGGLDGYNQDQTQTSSSLGAIIVVRQGNRVNREAEGIHKAVYPIAVYYARPPRKEQFYQIALMIAVHWNLKRNMMCNAEQDFVIEYFLKNYGKPYLSPRPKMFDSPKTQQVHKLGAKMTTFSKPMIMGLLQSWVLDYVQFCKFALLLRDLLAYDEEYIGTDWDLADALAYAIMRVEDMRTRPRKRDDDSAHSTDEAKWIYDKHGNPLLVEEPEEKTLSKKLSDLEGPGSWRGLNYTKKEDEQDEDFQQS